MNAIIMLGLTALSSIVGRQSSVVFDTTQEHLTTVSSFLNETLSEKEDGSFSITGVEYWEDVFSLEGVNRYIEFSLTNGYLIYDKEELEIDEYQTYLQNPYEGFQSYFKVYNEDYPDFKYLVYDSQDFLILNSSATLNKDSLREYYSNLSPSAGTYVNISDQPLASNATKIDNTFYYLNLNSYHGWNSQGTCTIVALQNLLGYYDTFYDDFVVNESFDVITDENPLNDKNIAHFTQSPGTDRDFDPYFDHDFHDYLVNLSIDEDIDDPTDNGMSTKEQIDLTKVYLNQREISYSLATSEGNWGDIITNRSVGIIKDAIDENRPVVSNGTGHSVVAFAYNNDYVWVHTGWGWVGATPWSTFESNIFTNYSAGSIDIKINGTHTHSDNYYSQYYDEYLCGCGAEIHEGSISQHDYGYEEQYFYYEKQLPVYLDDGHTLATKRLRTGYIEEEFINLSPRRSGAGTAYLEFYSQTPITKISVDISFWSNSESLSSYDSTAKIQYLSSSSTWENQLDLLNDVTLPTNRAQQMTIDIHFKPSTYAFRFYLTSSAVGDRNKGRISIGNLDVLHL